VTNELTQNQMPASTALFVRFQRDAGAKAHLTRRWLTLESDVASLLCQTFDIQCGASSWGWPDTAFDWRRTSGSR